MPVPDDYAAYALNALIAYGAKESLERMRKICLDDKGDDTKTAKNMRKWLKDNGFATEEYCGHMSQKPKKGAGISPQTQKFLKAVAAKLR
jgi:hypothetical protein